LIKNKRTKKIAVMESVRSFQSQDIFLRTTYELISGRLVPLETKIPEVLRVSLMRDRMLDL